MRVMWVLAIALALGVAAGCSDDDGPTSDSGPADGIKDGTKPGDQRPGHEGPVADSKPGQDWFTVECTDLTPQCCTISKEYDAKLAAAKQCTPGSAKCTEELPVGMHPCDCPTTVDANKTAEIDALKKLQADWTAAGCPKSECQCTPPKSSDCEKIGGVNKCVDKI